MLVSSGERYYIAIGNVELIVTDHVKIIVKGKHIYRSSSLLSATGG